ncbi:hypothetical protein CMV_026692 [Castanea mollissima]|uniref:Uncharacterized protein n=1 Tax=Castanea mollissima TaxID=60419 RepID=A0A8J4QAQ3_9ROSI|nr:hypothetical protein CMV_026692 [Castanea mollissima]
MSFWETYLLKAEEKEEAEEIMTVEIEQECCHRIGCNLEYSFEHQLSNYYNPFLTNPMATIGPMPGDDPSLQARGLTVCSFTPSGADSAPLDASSCAAGLAACRCGAPCSRIELSGVLPISVVSSVARRLERNSGPCVAYLPRRHSSL